MAFENKVALVAGGAGFIGSHLCDRLIAAGASVVCVDNFITGRSENLRHLDGHPRYELIEHDVIEPPVPVPAHVHLTHIYHLACAASPPHYQANPEHTLLTNVVGTLNLLNLASQHKARLLLTSTSEVYGEPEVHPQPEDYRGSVSCTGPRACYDEGKRAAELSCSISCGPAGAKSASRGCSTPMARGCGPTTGASFPISSARR